MQGTELLVALDGLPISEHILPMAVALADALHKPLRLVTVLSEDSEPGASRGAYAYLDHVAQNLAGPGRTVHRSVELGDPASTLCELADRSTVSMTLLATHGRTGLSRVILGSVADTVVRSAQRPLLLLRPGATEFSELRRIVVPLDGTPGGAVALSMAAPISRATGAKLVILRVATPPPLWIYEPTIGINTGPLIDPMWAEDARLAAEEYAYGIARRLRAAGLDADGRAESAQPAAAIIAVSTETDADLIVMSTHGRGASRPFLGSVSNQVVARSARPVLLVRRAGAYSAEPAAYTSMRAVVPG